MYNNRSNHSGHRVGELSGEVDLHFNAPEIHRAQAADFVPEGKEFKSWRKFWAYCRFYVKYLGYWIKYGYKNVPFEREARIYAPWPEYLEHRSRHAYKAFE